MDEQKKLQKQIAELEKKLDKQTKPEKLSVLKRLSKKTWIGLGALIVVLVVGIASYVYVSKQPKDVTGAIKVTFSGYNNAGRATLSGNYEKEIEKIIAAKKPKEVNQYIKDVTVTLDKSQGLYNGQKVKVTVKTTREDSPIKSATKTIIVSGLDKTPKISNLAEVLDRLDSQVRAFNVNSSKPITRQQDIYFISGFIAETNTGSDAEDGKSVDDQAFSLIAAYKFNFDEGDAIALFGYSNIEMVDGKVNLGTLSGDKSYSHLTPGFGKEIIREDYDTYRNFKTDQEVADWLKTAYPAAIKLKSDAVKIR
ncbi:MAG: hypothetical protein LBS41_00525 [Streptococcaceae bacterium]|nr:hypothetical protein [Streptococcaceae bacterium]